MAENMSFLQLGMILHQFVSVVINVDQNHLLTYQVLPQREKVVYIIFKEIQRPLEWCGLFEFLLIDNLADFASVRVHLFLLLSQHFPR